MESDNGYGYNHSSFSFYFCEGIKIKVLIKKSVSDRLINLQS
jgi:hypothetical protein